MSQMRKCPAQPRWVIIAENRIDRPSDYETPADPQTPAECPFCAGNESRTPEEKAVYRETMAENAGNGSGSPASSWSVRVVPNRYPAVRETYPAPAETCPDNGWLSDCPAFGAHEVIIESPRHVRTLTELPPSQMATVVQVYRDRLLHFEHDRRIAYVQLFKNVGPMAGASLEHVHSQLIALPNVPPRVAEKLRDAEAYRRRHGDCLYCDTIRREIELAVRVVADTEAFVAICPYASRFPFEIWVLPKTHQVHFGRTTDADCKALGHLLWDLCARVERVTDLARVSMHELLRLARSSGCDAARGASSLAPRGQAAPSLPGRRPPLAEAEKKSEPDQSTPQSDLTQPSYNLIMHTSPLRHGETTADGRTRPPEVSDLPGQSDEHGETGTLHWHLEILPTFVRPAGFEWGTGLHINPVSPENAAACLRNVPRA